MNETNENLKAIEEMNREDERKAKIVNLRMGNKEFVDKCDQFGCDLAYDRFLERADV